MPAATSWLSEENHFVLCSKTDLERRCRNPRILPDPLQGIKEEEEAETGRSGETGESVGHSPWTSSIQKSKPKPRKCPQLASASCNPLLPPKLRQDRYLPELWHLEMAKDDISGVRDSVLSDVAPAVLLPLCLCLGVPLCPPSTSCHTGGKFKPNKALAQTQAARGDGDRGGDMGWKSLLAGERGKISICSGGFGKKYGYVLVYPSFGRPERRYPRAWSHQQSDRVVARPLPVDVQAGMLHGCDLVTFRTGKQRTVSASNSPMWCTAAGLISQRWRKLRVKTDSKGFHMERHKLTWMSL